LIDLINNQIQFEVVALTLALPHIKDGKIKPLATLTHTRIKELPDVPTIEEAGYADAAFVPWYGIYVPAKTPNETAEKINAAISHALENPTVRDRLAKSDIPGKPMSLADLATLMKTDEAALSAVAKVTSSAK
jgi:tripartite-type tricarboxylate transporter receptor subunit TctC